jgi:hypothetical protein
MLKIAALAPLLLLAACDAEVKAPAAGDETVQMKADADGRVAFNLPFASLTGFNLDAGKDNAGKVNFTFTAPATPQEVKTYFLNQFRAQGAEAAMVADAIQGTTKEGATFVMRFAPQGTGTSGTIELDANK